MNKVVEFSNHNLLPMVFGVHGGHLKTLSEKFQIIIKNQGHKAELSGEQSNVQKASDALYAMYECAKRDGVLTHDDVMDCIRFQGGDYEHAMVIKTLTKNIKPRSPGQQNLIKTIKTHDVTFAVGPAGTGKTWLAVAYGVSQLLSGKVSRIIISRPAVEAGERLGFLPGDMKEKVDPYLRPVMDALHDFLGEKQETYKEKGMIEIAPLAFMRGRTLSNAFVILDEAQNTTTLQMKMFLTRLGEHSKMVITGDMGQIDLPHGVSSGLVDAVHRFKDVDGIGIAQLSTHDVMRHDLVQKIIKAYE